MGDIHSSLETWRFGTLDSSDAESVSAIDCALFSNGFEAKQVRVEIESGLGRAVWIQQQLAGYLLARRDGDLLEVTRLAVVPSFQRAGVAQALLDMLIRDENDAQYLTLHVLKENAGALRLYLKNGLHIVGEDGLSWVMQKSLRDGAEDALFLKVRE